MVSRRYRLVVISEPDGTVRELYLSRALLGAVAALGLLLVSSAVAALVFLGMRPARAPASLVPRSAPRLLGSVTLGSPESSASPGESCRAGMILIDGEYCPRPFHRCQRFTDPEGSALHGERCRDYEPAPRCLSPQRNRLRYCIDRDEFVAHGATLPENLRTFAEAQQACVRAGKRLCSETEWTFACEGEAMRPYPYGFARDSAVCNADVGHLVSSDGQLRDLRAAPGSFARCASAAGVRDLTGNVEEYVVADGNPERPLRKGGYWQPGANHCRASQPHPDPSYRGIELGFRCCADAAG